MFKLLLFWSNKTVLISTVLNLSVFDVVSIFVNSLFIIFDDNEFDVVSKFKLL